MAKIILMIILSVVALILVLVGVGFFISSLYLYLVSVFHNPTIATLFCGLAFLLLAILLLLIAILIKSSLFKFKTHKLAAKLQAVREDPSAEALHLVQEYPFRSVFAAVASGFVLGFCPKLRDSLIDGVATYVNTGSIADSLKAMKSAPEED